MSPTPRARVYRPTPLNLARLARVLAEGGLVATPSETVYGLAANALNARACRAIFKAKGRPANDPLIVHVDTLAQAETIAVFNDAARAVAAAFWPGPLTLVLPKQACVPSIVTSGQPSVAVRLPAHPLFRELIRRSGCALAAPSANPFGYISPTTAAHVLNGLGGRIGHILDGGPAEIGVESTIVDLRDPRKPAILRPGAISQEQLGAVLGRRLVPYRAKPAPKPTTTATREPSPVVPPAVLAPGMLERHYSPRTPLTLVTRISTPWRKAAGAAREALLFWKTPPSGLTSANEFVLTTKGDWEEGARHLFHLLRTLDDGRWRSIRAELAPGKRALALAINDRLTRAAAKR